jgi:uncharacterized protein (DUF58 family)
MSPVSRYLDPNLIQRLNQLSLSARSVVEGSTAGLHRSRLKGASIEFHQHRAYVPGDEPRRLDWRVLARTDRPYVREFHEETNLRAVILLDQSGSMAYGQGFETKFEYAARIAAAMSYLMLAQTESVGLGVYGETIKQWLAPHAHRLQLSRVIDLLEFATPSGHSDPETAMQELADRLGRRSLIIVLSDFFSVLPRLRRGMARLRSEGHEVIAMQVVAADELLFPFRGLVRFRGFEGERPGLFNALLLRKTYLNNIENHHRELEEACRVLGVQFARFVTDKPLEEALVWFLRRRALRG